MKKRKSILIAICVILLLVLASCGSLSSGSSVTVASDITQPTRWEYAVDTIDVFELMNYDLDQQKKMIQEKLNQKGLEGWELVQNEDNVLFFKRPLP